MAAFPRESAARSQLDFQLLREGGVTLFWRPAFFDDAMAWLAEAGYKVIELDAAAWADEAAFYTDIARALEFPDYFGRNLDALVDCLRDVADFSYAADSTSAGTAVGLRHYDSFVRSHAESAEAVLDILAGAAWDALLIGHRLLTLVQTDDPDLTFGPIGAHYARWNVGEWGDILRHPDRAPRNSTEEAWLRRIGSPPPWRQPGAAKS